MFESIGKVRAILNAEYVIIELAERPSLPDEVLTIFERVTPTGLREQAGIGHVDVPKGKVRLVAHQDGRLYLAERFRETKTQRRIVSRPPPSNLLSHLQGDKEEIAEEVPGAWSAIFDQALSLRVGELRAIKIGDSVAK